MVVNANARFNAARRKSIPCVKIPKNVKQALNIDTMYQNGMAKVEPLKKNCLYDRCYLFEEINYINKDEEEKDRFLNQFMDWLKAMNVDFKISIVDEYQSMDAFLERIRTVPNEGAYPEVEEGIKGWIGEKLSETNPNVATLRYLTVSCRADSPAEAGILFNALDTTICTMFHCWQGRIHRMDGEERLRCLHSLLRVGKKEEEKYQYLDEKGRHDWKNDVLPKTIRQKENFLILDDVCLSVLFGWKFQSAIDPDTCIRKLANVEFPSLVTMDFAPVPQERILEKLAAACMNNEKAISEEEERKRKNQVISIGPSYPKQRKKDGIEGYLDQVVENDETGFFMNFLVAVTAGDEDTLAERVKKMQAIGSKEGIVLETADYQQLKALNTALPYGGRQVDYMRFFLSSSVAAFQPFHAQDIIEPGGYMYGLNRTTKQLIFGNRKMLMNPHGIIIGHTGSGKSVLVKMTEILQTLVSTDDDILIIDPQNEFEDIVKDNGGSYFDLTPKSRIYLNGFEVPEGVFYGSRDIRERFTATQAKYAKSLTAAIMNNITFTQEHASVVGRCTRKMFEECFAQKNLKKQPTLRLLREEIRKELDRAENEYDKNVIRPIYNSMEEYTAGSCDMLARPSTVRLENRLVGFGMKNVPEDNWEAVMLTIMHYTSSRMEYNQSLQRATHFIVDETQVVSKKGTSADQLNTAVATFRKFGGICTMVLQNLTAALHNEQLKELFSNCSYKCFLDQGGVDANALAEIQELSRAEFDALNSGETGQGVMVWGKKVVLFDAKISKENVLYPLISTNFHEKAEEKNMAPADMAKLPEQKPETDREEDHMEQIIIRMAGITPVTAGDILSVLDITEEEAEEKLLALCRDGKLISTWEGGILRYKKEG
ncbi:Helicase HerA, central domain [Anaerobutyricum hallii]|uniref:Helicase HerA, central domain n=1 Tax=Anaerobutyricum hallii TaxID=39488 RepID=A0A285PU21_9FIRM|nr:DUF87 domain-containing protein [Anaerobutyricum hallii]SOB72692.1 Helicase HerA, central domain [Anaerobutyricum hallii]